MKYNVQLHTGSFFHSNITPTEAANQLKRVLRRIPADTVIWGWSSNKELNRAVSETLGEAGCGSFIWLPVFSETAKGTDSDSYIPIFDQDGSGIELSSDEHFEFVCPSSRKNMDNALNMAEIIAEGNYVTGIFMDRIRYPSAANSISAFAGCMCERCRAIYRSYGVIFENLKEILLREKAGGCFKPYAMEDCRYKFGSPTADGLFKAKRAVINEAVTYLSRRIHAMGLKVGIDTFAPFLADYVGQDLVSISAHADLIKPMFYFQTNAPAGIPFEAEAIEKCFGTGREQFETLWDCSLNEPSSIARQLEPLLNETARVSPGVEANCISGVCHSSADYVLQSREAIERLAVKTMTLSWNISLIPDSLFDILN